MLRLSFWTPNVTVRDWRFRLRSLAAAVRGFFVVFSKMGELQRLFGEVLFRGALDLKASLIVSRSCRGGGIEEEHFLN